MRADDNSKVSIESLYSNCSCALLAFAISGKIIQANDVFLSWVGISRENLTDKTFPEFLDKGGILYYQLFVQPLLRLHTEVNEINVQIKSSSDSFPCLLNAAMPESGENESIVYATLFKVLDRKKYESELLKRKVVAEEQ